MTVRTTCTPSLLLATTSLVVLVSSVGCVTPECPPGFAVEGSACIVVDPMMPLAVVETTPAADETGVEVDSTVEAVFDTDLDPESLTAESLTVSTAVGPTTGVAGPDEENPRALVFTPTGPLPLLAVQEAVVSTSVQDILGRSLQTPETWTFRTRDGLWSESERLVDAGCTIGAAIDVAFDSMGVGTAVWLDTFIPDPGQSACSLSSSRYTPGAGWTSPERLDSSTTGVESPDLAVQADGTALVVWVQDGRIYSRALSAEGEWSEAQEIQNSSPGQSASRSPQVAIAPGGVGVAVWARFVSQGATIFASRFAPTTETWQPTPFAISTAGAAYVFEPAPRVGMDDGGHAIAIFQQIDVANDRVDLWSSIFDPADEEWGAEQRIEANNSGDTGAPSLAVASDGVALAVWRQVVQPGDPNLTEIWSNVFDPDSGEWRAATAIDPDGIQSADDPSVAMIDGGTGMAAWTVDDDGFGRAATFASRFTGAAWDAPIAIEDGVGGSESPKVALDPQGNAIATGVRSVTPNSRDVLQVWRNRFSPGVGWDADAELLGESRAGDPAIAIDDLGRALLLWLENGPTSPEFEWSRFE